MSPSIWKIERAGDENRLQTIRRFPPRISPQPLHGAHLAKQPLHGAHLAKQLPGHQTQLTFDRMASDSGPHTWQYQYILEWLSLLFIFDSIEIKVVWIKKSAVLELSVCFNFQKFFGAHNVSHMGRERDLVDIHYKDPWNLVKPP